MIRISIIFALISLLMVTGCTSATATKEVPTAINRPETTEFPYPVLGVESLTSEYPAPEQPTEAPAPTIDPTLGIVKGELYLRGEPVKGALLFLSDVYQDNLGNDSVVSIDYNTENRATTREDGSFTFVNISPKRYALVAVEMPNSFLLLNPETQGSMVIVVTGNETVSTGKLDYDDLPFR